MLFRRGGGDHPQEARRAEEARILSDTGPYKRSTRAVPPDITVGSPDAMLEDVRKHLASGDEQEAIDALAAANVAATSKTRSPTV